MMNLRRLPPAGVESADVCPGQHGIARLPSTHAHGLHPARLRARGAGLTAAPGPNHLYIVTRSVSEGRRAGVVSALGVETGTLVHIVAAAFGLSALIASSAAAFNVVKYLGAGYLVYLGLRTLLRSAPATTPGPVPVRTSLRRTYAEGVVVNVLNPKVALFFLAFLPQFLDPARDSAAVQMLVLGMLLLCLGLVLDMGYAVAGGSLGSWIARRPRAIRRQRYVTGGVYLILGVGARCARRTTA